jgi:deoxyribonuclease-4
LDSDLAEANSLINKTKAQIFVHSQYIINLCVKAEDEWNTNLLKRNLQYTNAFGGKGVVVHVGKSVKIPLADALKQMRSAIAECLEHATPECPLLLETPAGQGTETLKDQKEFLDFVESFHDERLRICVDTCHVFACGHDPLSYIDAALARPGMLKLIHYNDSEAACGACLDRHALVGTGQIGLEKMTKIAERCSEHGLPMLIE